MAQNQIILPVRVEELGEGRVLAYTDAVQGCLAGGDSINDALENVEDVARVLLEVLEEDGVPLPPGMKDYKQRGFKAQIEARNRA
jgi:predicted RNase H-like HicB family nuclease